MFGFLKKLAFWKKKKAEEKPLQNEEVPSAQPGSFAPQAGQSEIPIKSVAQPPTAKPGEPIKEEKTCPKCGAPNDKFVHVCWLCKAEI